MPCRTCERGSRATGPHHQSCTPEARFWAKVLIVGPCWIWQGSTNGRYGEIRLSKTEKVYAHRFAYEHTWGALTDGQVVMHTCDTTLCVRPMHLVAGTQGDNIRDMVAKGRHAAQRRNAA